MTAISLDQIENVMSDIERRFEALGQGPAPALKLRMIIAMETGLPDAVREQLGPWRHALESRRSNLNDCRACDEATHVNALLFIDEHAEALAVGEGHIAGRSRCSTQPHYTLPRLIAPAREHAPDGLATTIRKKGYRLVDGNPKFYATIGNFVRDSLRQGQLDRAVDLIAKHRSWGDVSQDDISHWFFSSAARETLLRYRHLGKDLPNSLADTSGMGRSPEQVAEELINQAEDLGARFDTRNGNDWYREHLDADGAFATR